MTGNIPSKPTEFITDMNRFDSDGKSLNMSVSAKNIDRLRDLPIENLWLTGANDKELKKILSLVSLKYLSLYHVLARI